MASTYDFTLAGDPSTLRQVVFGALASVGHASTPRADGTYAVTRGSERATFWLGIFAGRRFHTRFTLQFFDGPGGSVARLTRVGSLGGWKGGLIGHSMTVDAFHDAAHTIDAVTRQSGVLQSVAEHGRTTHVTFAG